MPIYPYACTNSCGQLVELITKTANGPIPQQMTRACPRCKATVIFSRTVGVPAVLTPTTKAIARRNDYRREKPNAAENIMRGRTADGRPLQRVRRSERGIHRTTPNVKSRGDWQNRKKNAVKPELVESSEEKWGEAIINKYGETENPRQSEAVKEHAENYSSLVK